MSLSLATRRWFAICGLVALGGVRDIDAQSTPLLLEERLRLPAGLGGAIDGLLTDVDGDGRLDLVRATPESVTILIQDGAGEFAPHPLQPALSLGGGIRGVVEGRMRLTAVLPDIVVARIAAAPLILANNGSGIFAPMPMALPMPPTPVVSMLVGDIDRVPPDDLLVLPEQGRPQLLLSQGAGFRDASQWFASGLFLQSPVGALLDFDLDGDLDIALASAAGTAPFLLENNAGLSRQVALPAAGAHSAMATGDFDGDGRPDIALARAMPLPVGIEFVLNRTSGFVAYAPPTPFPLDVMASQLLARDVQGDRRADLLALQSDGRVRLAVGDGQPAFRFSYMATLLDPAPRARVAVGDLEGDGDADMVVMASPGVATVPDSVLVGHGSSLSWTDTEDVGFPIGLLTGAAAGAAVDVDGDGELDVAVYSPVGRGFVFRNDGTARFTETTGVVPALAMRDVRKVLRATIDTPDRDLLVVASAAGGVAMPPGLRVLLAQSGRYVDATARFPASLQRGFADVALARVLLPASGTRRIDDLILADTAGNLAVVANQVGAFIEVIGAFAPNVAFAPVRAVLVGDVDGDGRSDVVLVEHGTNGGGLQVFLRTATNVPPLFVMAQQPVVSFGAVRSAVLSDLDGDGHRDIVGVVESGAATSMLYLAGNGRGDFTDATATMFPVPLPAPIDSMAVVGVPRALPALMLGRLSGEPLLVLPRAGAAFGSPQELLVHGSPRAADLVVADFDGDGDDDCAVLAANVRPAILLGTSMQFSSSAVFQTGRDVLLRARVSDPASIAAWLWSPAGPTRLVLPSLGIVRLLPPIHSLAVFAVGPTLTQDIGFRAPALGSDITLHFQLAVFEPSRAAMRLSNLEPATILAR